MSESSLHDVAERDANANTKTTGSARHTIGIILLAGVIITWVSGTFLTASIFADHSYSKPLFITYFNTSSFLLLLIPILLKTWYKEYRRGKLRSKARLFFSRRTLKVFLGTEPEVEESHTTERDGLLPGSSYGTLPSYTSTDNGRTVARAGDEPKYLDMISTARFAVGFGLCWFVANYFTSACLTYTSPASATILGSTSSLWTLFIGVMAGTEKFTWRKLCGVFATISGIILISCVDLSSVTSDEEPDPAGSSSAMVPFKGLLTMASRLITQRNDLYADKPAAEIALGDFLALFGAASYGLYANLMARASLKAHPRELHMPTFFGFVGLSNAILTMPLFPILHYTGIETFRWPPLGRVLNVVLLYAISSAMTDLLMAYVTVMTSPLVVMVGLAMNIPLSLIGEMVLQHEYKGWLYWVGAAIVVASFIFVDHEESKDAEETKEEFVTRALENSRILSGSTVIDHGISSKSAHMTRSKTEDGDDDDDNSFSGNEADDELYTIEKKRNGKQKMKQDIEECVDEGEEEEVVCGSMRDFDINNISSSGPSSYGPGSYDRRYRSRAD